MRVSDTKFNGMTAEKQQELVMELLPPNIKNEICLETIPTEVDTMPRKVVLKQCVVSRSNKQNPTPQGLLDDAVYFLKQGNGNLASKSSWDSACLQLKYFLMKYNVDADSHDLKRGIIDFLLNYFTDEELEDRFFSSWNDMNEAHYNFYNNVYGLPVVEKFLISSETFSNILFDLNVTFKDIDLINHLGKKRAKQLKVPIGEEWKEINNWILENKLLLDGQKPNIRLIYI